MFYDKGLCNDHFTHMQELEGELAATKKALEQAQAEMRTLNQVIARTRQEPLSCSNEAQKRQYDVIRAVGMISFELSLNFRRPVSLYTRST
jgi:chromosome segregation ATPase